MRILERKDGVRTSRRSWWVAFTVALALVLGSGSAGAVTLGFGCITLNDLTGTNCGIGEAQLTVDVTDEGGGQIRFTFNNVGPDDITISEVYFDDGVLLGIASVIDGPGVNFEQDANPPDLPAGNTISPPFEVTAGFLAEAQPPPAHTGVDPGENVAIIFDLQGGGSFADIINELADGTLRIGIHAISIGPTENSESFVNNPVPEPGTLALLALSTAGLALAGRRR